MHVGPGDCSELAAVADPYGKRSGFYSVALTLAGIAAITLILLDYPYFGIAVLAAAAIGIVKRLFKRP